VCVFLYCFVYVYLFYFMLLFNFVNYVLFLLRLRILIVMYALFCIFYSHRAKWLSPTTLTEDFPCFFLNCKANGRI
jgi:hypothetical protein